MSCKLTILGCGSSGGVPRLGNDWGACDPANPKNRRLRCSVLIERFAGERGQEGPTRVLIDTTPDLRAQLLAAGVDTVDGVLYTHDHADHTHGIDDLRVLGYNKKAKVKVYMDEAVSASLVKRFAYCFEKIPASGYRPILEALPITPPDPVRIEGGGGPIEAIPVVQRHGAIHSLGFRIGNLAYSPDISSLPDSSVELLLGLDVWIVDALRRSPHPSHFSVADALNWIRKLRPKRAILTHLHVDLDYDSLRRELPKGVEPAHDGMIIDFE